MSRKHKHRRRQPLRCFVFTPETMTLAQKAMQLFAQSLSKAESQPEKAAFAEAMMKQVNSKLAAMAVSGGMMHLTTFDHNEKMVLAIAIQLYMLDLHALSVSAQQDKELRQCEQIVRFALDPGREPGP